MNWSGSQSAENPVRLWGYIKNADGSPAPYPRLSFIGTDGVRFDSVYVGDGGGVYDVWIPNTNIQVEVFTNGNKTLRVPAYMLSGATTNMEAGSGYADAVEHDLPPAGSADGGSGGMNTSSLLKWGALGFGAYFLGKQMGWWK